MEIDFAYSSKFYPQHPEYSTNTYDYNSLIYPWPTNYNKNQNKIVGDSKGVISFNDNENKMKSLRNSAPTNINTENNPYSNLIQNNNFFNHPIDFHNNNFNTNNEKLLSSSVLYYGQNNHNMQKKPLIKKPNKKKRGYK